MRPLRVGIGVILILAGLVWVMQGFGLAFAPQSFMTGDPTWIGWGLVAIAVGAVLILVGRRT